MGGLFAPYSPRQGYLLPPSVDEWLPKDHAVYFILDVIEGLDLSSFEKRYRSEGSGNVAYPPQMMLAIMIYGYMSGIVSSRKLERAILENLAFRVLAGGHRPGHRTIARFRERHVEDFEDVFVQVVRFARDADLVDLGLLAIDGTKIRANASCRKTNSYKALVEEEKRLKQRLDELLAESRKVDEEEDESHGDRAGHEMSPEWADRNKRLEKIRQSKQRIEERQLEADADKIEREKELKAKGKKRRGRKRTRPLGRPKDSAQDNLTDPDSRTMRFADGTFRPGFNAQIGVDAKNQIIVGTGLSRLAGDHKLLVPMVQKVQETVGNAPDLSVADAGYQSERNFRQLEDEGHNALVALRARKKPKPDPDYPATERMREKTSSPEGRATMKRRGQLAEPPFSWIKRCLGFVRFSMRSFAKSEGEWALVCLVLNLKRVQKLLSPNRC